MEKTTKKRENRNLDRGVFRVVMLGIIFDPKTRRILIGRREKDPYIKELSWVFPGGKLNHNETAEQGVIREMKEETGLKIADLGTIFSKIPQEDNSLLLIYHLCEAIGGKEKPSGDLKELKWVSPDKLEKYFTTSFHPKLKEYILNLK